MRGQAGKDLGFLDNCTISYGISYDGAAGGTNRAGRLPPA
jgi:hypothetical protein